MSKLYSPTYLANVKNALMHAMQIEQIRVILLIVIIFFAVIFIFKLIHQIHRIGQEFDKTIINGHETSYQALHKRKIYTRRTTYIGLIILIAGCILFTIDSGIHYQQYQGATTNVQFDVTQNHYHQFIKRARQRANYHQRQYQHYHYLCHLKSHTTKDILKRNRYRLLYQNDKQHLNQLQNKDIVKQATKSLPSLSELPKELY